MEELDRLDLGQDEWDALQSEHTRLAHAQSLLDGAGQILEALDGDGDSAHHRLNSAGQRLQQMLRHDPGLQGVVDEIESARIAVSEAVSDLNNYVSRVDLDPQRLADVEARLSAVFETARKFRVEPDGLCGLREDLHAAVRPAGGRRHRQPARADPGRPITLRRRRGKLGTARRKVAKDLGKLVTQAMQTLAMQGPLRADAVTRDAVRARQRTGRIPGGRPCRHLAAPLAKVASGGELSRISLALSVIASRARACPR